MRPGIAEPVSIGSVGCQLVPGVTAPTEMISVTSAEVDEAGVGGHRADEGHKCAESAGRANGAEEATGGTEQEVTPVDEGVLTLTSLPVSRWLLLPKSSLRKQRVHRQAGRPT